MHTTYYKDILCAELRHKTHITSKSDSKISWSNQFYCYELWYNPVRPSRNNKSSERQAVPAFISNDTPKANRAPKWSIYSHFIIFEFSNDSARAVSKICLTDPHSWPKNTKYKNEEIKSVLIVVEQQRVDMNDKHIKSE